MLKQGKKAVVKEFSREGTTYYRVQVRAGKTLAAAGRMEASLESRFPGAFVIAR